MALETYDMSVEEGRNFIFKRACDRFGHTNLLPPSNHKSLDDGFMDHPELKLVTFHYNVRDTEGSTHAEAIKLVRWYHIP